MSSFERLDQLSRDVSTTLLAVRNEFDELPSESLTHLQKKAELLESLAHAEKILQEAAKTLGAIHKDGQSQVTAALETIDKQLSGLKNVLNHTAAMPVVTNTPESKPISYASKLATATTTVVKPDTPTGRPRHEIAAQVHIEAHNIKDPAECHNYLGWWCYCSNDRRFYVSINGFAMSAVTTEILDGSIKPYKFHELLPRNNHLAKNEHDCEFYVSRELYPKSNDRRMLTNRAIYVPSCKVPEKHEKWVYRIGSRAYLADDLYHMTDFDYRTLKDQTGNFMLCMTAAHQENARRNNEPIVAAPTTSIASATPEKKRKNKKKTKPTTTIAVTAA